MASRTHVSRQMWIYALTIFLSAFLLFQVQPLISKFILPWFGGTPSVWTTCMLFFQVLLFLGYAYAHFLTACCRPRQQALLHVALLLTAAILLPITPGASWKPDGTEQPVLRIVLLLAATVGLPFFVLSTTGPLLQRWFSFTQPDVSPYRLYALSNAGSLLALVSYPFVVEPALPALVQTWVWSAIFVAFAVLCAICAANMGRSTAAAATAPDAQQSPGVRDSAAENDADVVPPSLSDRLLWFGLAMAASVMLLATTNQVCLDVAAVPFLWVLPLTIYLASFILCFESERWYSRRTFATALGVSMVTVTLIMLQNAGASLFAQVLTYFSGLFFCAMVCHGELVKLKPHPRYLTMFYLVVAAGGAGGGLFVGLIAPLIFPAYLELHFGILACCLLTLAIFFRDRDWILYRGRPGWAWGAMLLAVCGLGWALQVQASGAMADSLDLSRNFYGVLRVREDETDDPQRHCRRLFHGRIEHGMQFLSKERRGLPTVYYGPESAAGLVLGEPVAGGRRVGVIGLGVGTLAAYAEPEDSYRFYEINPEVTRLAREYFSYLSDCRGTLEIVTGDARLSLEREERQQFDVFVLDAFAGDAIPMHLLTAEAFVVYASHLVDGGVLAIHISNKHFDLRPVVRAGAERLGMQAVMIRSSADPERGINQATWVLVTGNSALLARPDIAGVAQPIEAEPLQWSDDTSNLFEVLR